MRRRLSHPDAGTRPKIGRWLRAAGWLGLLGVAARFAPGKPVEAQTQIVLKIASSGAEGSPLDAQLVELERYLENATSGHVRVKRFAGALSGDDALERTREGGIQAFAGPVDQLASVLPAAEVVAAPYLFLNYRRADAVLDRPLRKAIAAQLQERGLRFAMWGPSDFRVWYSRGRALLSPDDAQGLTSPRPRTRIHAALLDTLGVHAGPDPLRPALPPHPVLPELFDATLLEAAAASFDRGAEHMTLSRHSLEASIVVYSERWLEGLPQDVQGALADAPHELTERARRAQRKTEARMIERLHKLGVKTHEHSRKQRRAFARATRASVDRAVQSLGGEARALLRAAR